MKGFFKYLLLPALLAFSGLPPFGSLDSNGNSILSNGNASGSDRPRIGQFHTGARMANGTGHVNGANRHVNGNIGGSMTNGNGHSGGVPDCAGAAGCSRRHFRMLAPSGAQPNMPAVAKAGRSPTSRLRMLGFLRRRQPTSEPVLVSTL